MTEAGQEHIGRCLCATVRFRVTGAPLWTAFCHCESCRRATAAPVTAYAGFAEDNFAFTDGTPTEYVSSPGVLRRFCPRCGTPLTFQGERWPGEVHIFLATLEDPEAFPPESQGSYVGERLSWMHVE